ncbi:MAG: hypothetical protein WCX88_03250 [Patescibacteria group bacterium]
MRKITFLIVFTAFAALVWASNPADLTDLYRLGDMGSGVGISFNLKDTKYDNLWGYTSLINENKTRSGYLYLAENNITLVGVFSACTNFSIGMESTTRETSGTTNTLYPDIHGNINKVDWGVGISSPFVMKNEKKEINVGPRAVFFDGKIKVCASTNLAGDDAKIGATVKKAWGAMEIAYQPDTKVGWLRLSKKIKDWRPEVQVKFHPKGTSLTFVMYF